MPRSDAEFNLEQVIAVANKLVIQAAERNLTDVEITILTGAWKREEYDAIAAQNNYSTSYLSQDVAPKLWKLLSETLEEKVKKSNFKEVLRRYWQATTAQELVTAKFEDEGLDPPPNTQEIDLNSIASLYVERFAIESICCQTLSQPGALLRLKGARLLGKTFLMERVLGNMSQQGYAIVNLSLKLADQKTHFTNLNRFLRWFCSNITKELELPNKVKEYWDEEDLGSKVSCTSYFQDYILDTLQQPIILCLDDIDLLFPYPEIYEDFFALLRSWYEKARTRPRWQNLRLTLVHATDVYIRLNIYQSPFNIGLLQELPEFTISEVRELALKHQIELKEPELDSLIDKVGGHPFLLQKIFDFLKSDRTLNLRDILTEAATESGIFSHHLRNIWLDLQQHPKLALAFSQLLVSEEPISLDPIQAYQLQNIGLIKLTGNLAELRCNLYRLFFSEHLKIIS
ncbi:MAG: AAA-like domain-containing protein [Cyanobacteria bacterium P01_C01_bin.72]